VKLDYLIIFLVAEKEKAAEREREQEREPPKEKTIAF